MCNTIRLMKQTDLANADDHILNDTVWALVNCEILKFWQFLFQSISACWCASYLNWQFRQRFTARCGEEFRGGVTCTVKTLLWLQWTYKAGTLSPIFVIVVIMLVFHGRQLLWSAQLCKPRYVKQNVKTYQSNLAGDLLPRTFICPIMSNLILFSSIQETVTC